LHLQIVYFVFYFLLVFLFFVCPNPQEALHQALAHQFQPPQKHHQSDDNINNTKDLTTTIGHETSHALDNQDPSINTNPQNNASKTDNEIYADN
jgi:hypothetical protein